MAKQDKGPKKPFDPRDEIDPDTLPEPDLERPKEPPEDPTIPPPRGDWEDGYIGPADRVEFKGKRKPKVIYATVKQTLDPKIFQQIRS